MNYRNSNNRSWKKSSLKMNREEGRRNGENKLFSLELERGLELHKRVGMKNEEGNNSAQNGK